MTRYWKSRIWLWYWEARARIKALRGKKLTDFEEFILEITEP